MGIQTLAQLLSDTVQHTTDFSELSKRFRVVCSNIRLDQVDDLAKETVAKVIGKFGNAGAETAGAQTKATPNRAEEDEFQRVLNVTMAAAVRQHMASQNTPTRRNSL